MGTAGTLPYFVQARQIARAYGALTALGAWDATPTPLVCVGASKMTLMVEYDEAAPGGAVEVQAFFSPYALAAQVPAGQAEWFPASVKAVGAVVPGANVTSLVQPEVNSFDPTVVTNEGIVIDFELPGAMERFQVNVREVGLPANVGISGVIALLSW